jgi:hypothetical protein
MRAPRRWGVVVPFALAALAAGCGFSPHPKSGTVTCKPGGASCCPADYLCVGRSPTTPPGLPGGKCWSKSDLPPEALLATHDQTPTVTSDPVCLVTDWLPPVVAPGMDAGAVDTGSAPDGGGPALDVGTIGGGDAPMGAETAGDTRPDLLAPRPDGPEAGVDGPLGAGDVAPDAPMAGADGGVDGSGSDGAPALDGGGLDGQVADGGAVVPRRLPLPCGAPLPTGYCMVSDVGDWPGGGKTYVGSGASAVKLYFAAADRVNFDITLSNSTTLFDADFAAPDGQRLVPGLYNPAERYPFQTGNAAGMTVLGGCNTITGRFSVEELQWDPGTGLVRFSAIFEQHCEGVAPALRGVINFQASGYSDPTPRPDRTINLSGKIFRVAYDPVAHLAYGLDATNRRLAKIDLTAGSATLADVLQIPNDGCLDAKRGRLFVVNKGSSLITEYRTADLTAVRDINWAGTDWGPTDTHFKIYCAPERLYVVDGAWAPGLFTVEGLAATPADGSDGGNGAEIDAGDEGIDGGDQTIDGGDQTIDAGDGDGPGDAGTDAATPLAGPVAIDHSETVAGVGGLALNAAATRVYTWYQYGWNAGSLNTDVTRLDPITLSEVDKSASNLPTFHRDPLDAPLLLDESRGLLFVKNYIFDANNLSKVVYSLPSAFDTFDGAAENVYAIDPVRGLMATKNFIYDLTRFAVVAATLDPDADQLFFDKDGVLWFLSLKDGALKAQVIKP